MTSLPTRSALAVTACLALAACCGEEEEQQSTNENSGQQVQTDVEAPTTNRIESADAAREARHAEWLSRAVVTGSLPVAQGTEDFAAFEAAAEELGLPFPSQRYLSVSFSIVSNAGTEHDVTALGYCGELLESRHYQRECTDIIQRKIAIGNGLANFGLASAFATNNPDIRPAALVSHEWMIRQTQDTQPSENLYMVTDITNYTPRFEQ